MAEVIPFRTNATHRCQQQPNPPGHLAAAERFDRAVAELLALVPEAAKAVHGVDLAAYNWVVAAAGGVR